jgi:hypothetical protein
MEAYRTIQTFQRVGRDAPETVLRFDPETRLLSVGGTRFEADWGDCEQDILEFLVGAGEPQTQAQIRDGVEGHSTKVIRAALTSLVGCGKVKKTGDGTKGKPFLYESQNSGSQYISGTRKPESQNQPQTHINTSSILVPGNLQTPSACGKVQNSGLGEQLGLTLGPDLDVEFL